MLKIIKGDLLKSNVDIICHQVNEDGIMGGGIALQIATKYPIVEREYKNYCRLKTKEQLLGNYLLIETHKHTIANCFTQENFITRLDLVEKVFKNIKSYAKDKRKTIGISYKYGCGIAKGNWKEVEKILNKIFSDYCLYVYKLEDKESL